MFRNQYKNFFYRMKITSADGNHSTELTEPILRAVTSVTISESSYSDDSQTYPTLTLVLNQPQYLPDNSTFNPSAQSKGAGLFTNKPGSLTDLRFDSEKGFTYVSKDEMESGVTRTDRNKSNTSQPVVFLFGGGNKIEIEWGLLEPVKKSRKRIFTINTINLQGGGSGDGTLTITALDGKLLASKTNLTAGKVFANANTKQPNTLKQVLFQVCKVLDYDLEFDGVKVNEFPPFTSTFVQDRTAVGGDTAPPDPSSPLTLTRHTDLHSFVGQLANQFSSSYEYDNDTATGRVILRFKPRAVRYGSVDYEFIYKASNSPILSYKVDSMEGQFNPTTSTSSVVDGGTIENNTIAQQLTIKNEKPIGKEVKQPSGKIPSPSDPNAIARIQAAIPGLSSAGTSSTHPSKSTEALNSYSKSLYEANKYISFISLTTIGDPDYKPGTAFIDNIGLRYSKTYRMFTVQHTLSNGGYTCSWSGKSEVAGKEGGVSADEAAKENKTLQIQLTKINE